MGRDITATKEQIDRSVRGIVMHLEATGIAKNHNSFAEAMEELGMWDFVNNMAEVQATASEYNRHLHNIIHRGMAHE